MNRLDLVNKKGLTTTFNKSIIHYFHEFYPTMLLDMSRRILKVCTYLDRYKKCSIQKQGAYNHNNP